MADDELKGFVADLYALYRAGRVLLPEIAATYESMAGGVHDSTGYVNALFGEFERENTQQDYYSGSWLPAVEPAHRKLMALREDLQGVFRESSLILHDTGTALVMIADSYRTTDEINELFLKEIAGDDLPGMRERYDEPPLPRPDPPGRNDPYPEVRPAAPPGSGPAGRYPTPDVSE